jgi:hypothetical protein
MMAVSGNNVYVVWRENNDIYFKASTNNGGTFGSPINLSGNAGTSQAPHIAAAGDNVYVVWQDDTLGNFEIYFKRSINNGTSFSSPVTNLSNDAAFRSGGLLSHLDLAASDSSVYVVWQKDDQSAANSEISFRRSNDNGLTFAPVDNLSNTAGASSQAPQLAAVGNNTYVVWRDSNPGNFDIFFRASNNTGISFTSTLNLSSNIGSSQTPQIAASASDVYVVWRDSNPGNFDILLKASNDNGTSFGTEINLSSNTGSSQSPQIDASEGNAYVAWRDDTPGNLDIFFRATNDNGGTFGTAINMSDNSGSSQSPDVEASAGDVYVAWYDSTPGNFDIFFRASNDTGSTFGTALNLSNNSGSSQSPDVEASADEIYAAWYDNTPGNNEILFKSTDDAPTANNQSVPTNEDTPKIITLTGSDPEVDPLTFMIVTPPLNGTLGPITVVNPTASNVTYTPDLNFFGADSFTFKASDGTLSSGNAMVNITVNSLNDPPAANNQNVTTSEDSGAFSITLTGSDPENDTLTFFLLSNPLNGTLATTSSNDTVTYTPDLNFFGADSFTFRVKDTVFSNNNATVTINVTGINDPPVANNDSVTITEDTVGTFDITVSVVTSVLANDTDVDGDTLIITAIPIPPENGTAIINGTETGITYTPFGNFSGIDAFDYRISDGNGGNATATVSVNVTQINDAPIANNINYTTPEDIPVTIDLTGSDEEQSELEFTIVTPPQNGTLGNITQSLSVDDASVLYTPNPNFFGTDSFTFMVNDTVAQAIDTAAVNITITAVNDPPLAFDDIFTIEGNSAANLDILANDDDDDDGGDGLTIISTSSPSNGNVTITGNGTLVMYAPDLNFIGVDSFDYSINDTNNVVSAASVDIIVEPPETFKVKKGTFAKSTAAAPVIQNITGVGFEPKALILFTTDQSAEGLTDSYNFAMGFSNGTASRTVAVKSDDNAGTSNTGRAFGKNVLRIIGSGDPIVVAQANVIGFNSDGFALNWTSNTSTPSIIHYLALGGIDITDVRVSNFRANTTAVNQTVVAGFQPDFLMFMHASSGNLVGKASHGYMSYGFATSPTERAAIAVTSEDNRNLMDTKRWQRTDRAIIALEPSTGAIDAQGDLLSMNPDGFTINWIDSPADPDRVYYLAIKGGSYGVGSFNTPLAQGPQPISGVGLQPRGLILTSFGDSSSASIRNDNRVSLGAAHATGDGNEGSVWVGDRGLVDTSLTARSSVTTKVIRIATENSVGSTSVITAAADLESFDADGFTLNWTTILGGGLKQIIYVAFG